MWDSTDLCMRSAEGLRRLVFIICMTMGPGLCAACGLLMIHVLVRLQQSRDRIMMSLLDLPTLVRAPSLAQTNLEVPEPPAIRRFLHTFPRLSSLFPSTAAQVVIQLKSFADQHVSRLRTEDDEDVDDNEDDEAIEFDSHKLGAPGDDSNSISADSDGGDDLVSAVLHNNLNQLVLPPLLQSSAEHSFFFSQPSRRP